MPGLGVFLSQNHGIKARRSLGKELQSLRITRSLVKGGIGAEGRDQAWEKEERRVWDVPSGKGPAGSVVGAATQPRDSGKGQGRALSPLSLTWEPPEGWEGAQGHLREQGLELPPHTANPRGIPESQGSSQHSPAHSQCVLSPQSHRHPQGCGRAVPAGIFCPKELLQTQLGLAWARDGSCPRARPGCSSFPATGSSLSQGYPLEHPGAGQCQQKVPGTVPNPRDGARGSLCCPCPAAPGHCPLPGPGTASGSLDPGWICGRSRTKAAGSG